MAMFINLLKEKRLRKRVYFTLLVLAVASALTQIPVIGLNRSFLGSLFAGTGILTFVDSLSGGSLSNMSVAGFGITSYITASIIIQLLAVVFPQIETIRRDGERGRKLIEKATFVGALLFTAVGGTVLAIGFGKRGMFVEYSPVYVLLAVLSWIIGSFVIIFLGQKVEEYGIGNGITLILGFNILSRIPNNIISFYRDNVSGKPIAKSIAYIVGLVVFLFVFYTISVYLQKGVLNIPIKQTRKQASDSNTDGRIPISANIANVLPVIYASSLVSFPVLIVTLFGIDTDGVWTEILDTLNSANWYNPTKWYHVIGVVLYIVLIVAFGLFSSELSFSPDEIADSMKKNGNVIPNINPGKDTVDFLNRRRKIMSMVNVAFLLVIAVVPDVVCAVAGIGSFAFLGTSLIIIISMLFDTALRIKAVSIHNDKKFRLFGGTEKAV